MQTKILSTHAMRARFPRSRSMIYEDIKNGTFIPPIKLGPRSNGWIEIEVEAVLAARAAELPPSRIKALVSELMEVRRHPDAEVKRMAVLAKYLGRLQ
jgi:predicted DNA-binding transcriptional regulator AlpA